MVDIGGDNLLKITYANSKVKNIFLIIQRCREIYLLIGYEQ